MKKIEIIKDSYIALLKAPISYRLKCQDILCKLRDKIAETEYKKPQEIQDMYEYIVAMSEKDMIICFELSMPRNNAWNNKWTGEDNCYVIVENFGKNKKAQELAINILYTKEFHYDFGDGWLACISVRRITKDEAKQLRKKSEGFAGYEWMVKSIKDKLEISAEVNCLK